LSRCVGRATDAVVLKERVNLVTGTARRDDMIEVIGTDKP